MHRLTTAILAFTLAAPLAAQTHRVQRYEGITRAVGVYEWTGDIAKPEASRLIPVSLFIYGHFEDAGVYLAQPVPMALDNGVRYQVQFSGVNKGVYDILYGRHLDPTAGVNAHYDEGWFGYGKYSIPKPKAPAKVTIADDDTPKKKSDNDKPDPERPTFQKEDDKAGKEKAPKDVASVTPVNNNPADDDDRPVLHKRDTAQPPAQSTPAVTQNNKGVLDDPDRPVIHRGRPANSITGVDVEHLRGLPKDLHQAIAVSDPVDRPEHNFAHTFTPDERAKITAEMEKMARDVLANPSLAAQMANPTATPDNAKLKLAMLAPEQQPKSATAAKTTAKTTAQRRISARTKTPVAPAPVELQEEDLRAFDLAYNSVPVYVLSAHTAGEGAGLQYVTIVAQPDTFGTLQPVMRSLTDATHLDRTPWMRLIDAVDADASNRACLLFELRANGSRQFSLYRIYAGQPTQVFLTGSTL